MTREEVKENRTEVFHSFVVILYQLFKSKDVTRNSNEKSIDSIII